MIKIVIVSLILSVSGLLAETNLGTINTIISGRASLRECGTGRSGGCQDSALPDQLASIIKNASVGSCISSAYDLQKSGVDVPKCPKGEGDLKGLDHTYPAGGIFALYYPRNEQFISDLVKGSQKSKSKINLVVVKSEISELLKDSTLINLIDQKRINFIIVDEFPRVGKWMQDSFEFASLAGKPALYQLEHGNEIMTPVYGSLDKFKTLEYKDRFACQIANSCNLPYFIPPDLVDPMNIDSHTINSGGNLEVLPGGTFYRGVVMNPAKSQYVPIGAATPYQTPSQQRQKEMLEKSKNRVLDLDISFLKVGHVDEFMSVVKTDRAAPCNFAVMIVDPQLAFDLLEEKSKSSSALSLVIGDAYAASKSPPECQMTSFTAANVFENEDGPLEYAEEVEAIYNGRCINGMGQDYFVKSQDYEIIKRENESIKRVLKENERKVVDELKATTACQSPVIIRVPTFYRDGLSYTPNLVNSLIQTESGPSHVLAPRSYIKSFESYLERELQKYGVTISYVKSMNYHLKMGDVHCGTNSARVCLP